LWYLREGGEKVGEQEKAYAEMHQRLLEAHYTSSFMGAFPEALRGLEDRVGTVNMVEGPDTEGAVFARGLGSRYGNDEDDEGEGLVRFRVRGRDEDGVADVMRGEVVVARWADVKDSVEKGEMELV